MSSEIIEPPVAPELPRMPEVSKRSTNDTLKKVVYWSLMGLGIVIPPALGLYGTLF